jgi:hypothetical protein
MAIALFEPEGYRQEEADDFRVGASVPGNTLDTEAAASGKRHRQHQLVPQVLANGSTGSEITACFLHNLFGNCLGTYHFFANRHENLADMIVPDGEQQDIAGAMAVRQAH